MDTALVGITVIAVVLAATMTGIAMRLLREERRRSAARVAALSAELAGAGGADFPLREHDVASAAEPARRSDRVREARVPPSRTIEAPVLAQELSVSSTSGTGMFVSATRKAGLPRPAIAVGAIGIAIAVAGSALLTSKTEEPAPLAASAPLELLSLRHSRQADTLTITGFVRNPDGAAAMNDVTAVAFLFDRDGGFLASGRGALDFRTLSPGDESPFVITIPVTGSVGRYRVSFRGVSGAMAPHVDRRARP